jgi:hypothetical protein
MKDNEIIKFLQSKQIPQCGDKEYTADEEYEAYQGAINALEQTTWIPVSERLPEICEEDCHGNITFSKTVLTTQIYGDGYVHVGIDKYTTNNGGGWLMEVPFDNPEECCEVIAWMPLPQAYREVEE